MVPLTILHARVAKTAGGGAPLDYSDNPVRPVPNLRDEPFRQKHLDVVVVVVVVALLKLVATEQEAMSGAPRPQTLVVVLTWLAHCSD